MENLRFQLADMIGLVSESDSRRRRKAALRNFVVVIVAILVCIYAY